MPLSVSQGVTEVSLGPLSCSSLGLLCAVTACASEFLSVKSHPVLQSSSEIVGDRIE